MKQLPKTLSSQKKNTFFENTQNETEMFGRCYEYDLLDFDFSPEIKFAFDILCDSWV